jgi:hypothetical protein
VSAAFVAVTKQVPEEEAVSVEPETAQLVAEPPALST